MTSKKPLYLVVCLSTLVLFGLPSGSSFSICLAPSFALAEQNPQQLWKLYGALKQSKWIDLTHSFDATIPHWKGFEPMTTKVLYDHEKDGFKVQEFCHVGQWGTHVDPPVHFHKTLRTAEDIPPSEMLLPLVVFDVHEKVEQNPDYTLTLDDIQVWEKRNGAVPEGAFAVMRTDWSKRWPSQEKMLNVDAKGIAHYPGWSLAA